MSTVICGAHHFDMLVEEPETKEGIVFFSTFYSILSARACVSALISSFPWMEQGDGAAGVIFSITWKFASRKAAQGRKSYYLYLNDLPYI